MHQRDRPRQYKSTKEYIYTRWDPTDQVIHNRRKGHDGRWRMSDKRVWKSCTRPSIKLRYEKNRPFYSSHTCAAVVHSMFQLWQPLANHFHATESISFLADLYSSSLFTKASLFSIKAGSSSSIALSCFFCIVKSKANEGTIISLSSKNHEPLLTWNDLDKIRTKQGGNRMVLSGSLNPVSKNKHQ